ncbi:MAG: hypothetical protein CM15mP122_4420 [Bacteroidota bacterium]|nr:MAG: hypothetical protein CM15mP122_4420 [Bacteroidota bacterium]
MESVVRFGTGFYGRYGCPILDPSFYALDLGFTDRNSSNIYSLDSRNFNQTYPPLQICKKKFPKRGKHPEVNPFLVGKVEFYPHSRGEILKPGERFTLSGAISGW